MAYSEKITKLTMDSTIGEFRDKFNESPDLKNHCKMLWDLPLATVKNGDGDSISLNWKPETALVLAFLLGNTIPSFPLPSVNSNQWLSTMYNNKNNKGIKKYYEEQYPGFSKRDYGQKFNGDTYKKFKALIQDIINDALKNFGQVSEEKLSIQQLVDTLTQKAPGRDTYKYPTFIPNKNAEYIFKTVLEAILVPTSMEKVVDLIENGEARQIIFTGAPGTGKTYIAKEIAKYFKEQGQAADISLESVQNLNKDPQPYVQVQFHPSYDYTDFVEGLRPIATTISEQGSANAGSTNFAKVDGIFKEFCRTVATNNKTSFLDTQKTVKDTAEKLKTTLATVDPCKLQESKKDINTILCHLAEGAAKKAALTLADAIDTALDLQEISSAHKKFASDSPDMERIKALLFPVNRLTSRGNTSADLKKLENALNSLHFAEKLRTSISADEADAARYTQVAELGITDPECALQLLLDELKRNYDAALAHILLAILLKADAEQFSDKQLKDLKNAINETTTVTSIRGKLSDISPIKADTYLARLQDNCYKSLQALNLEFPNLVGLAENLAEQLEDPNAVIPEPPLYFFIIDEINRANLSKVFGELMYCMEKDKRGPENAIHTQYQNLPTYKASGQKLADTAEEDVFANGFYIPKNVVIIGTMNDIDRSVDSMDFALRRRFEWLEFVVDQNSLTRAFENEKSYGVFIKKHARQLAEHVCNLNEHLKVKGSTYGLNRQYFIGHGHFANLPQKFMTGTPGNSSDADRDLKPILQYVWEYRIESLLREYLRGEAESTIESFIKEARNHLIP